MTGQIKQSLTNIRGELEYRLRILCGRPTPMKRFIAVIIIGVVFAVANVWFVASSIYHMGSRDAKEELIKLQHIETLKLKQQRDTLSFPNHQQSDEIQPNDGRE